MPRGFTRQHIELAMKNGSKFHGAVVPLVTPFTAAGELDEPALARLVDAASRRRCRGNFCPRHHRRGSARAAGVCAAGWWHWPSSAPPARTLVFAGLGDVRLADLSEANEFFQIGADAVVAHPPISRKSLRRINCTTGIRLCWRD
jgi:hypothetical protein